MLTAGRLVRLRSGAEGKAGRFPSYTTVLDRFGRSDRVAQLLDGEGTATSHEPGCLPHEA